MFSKYNPISKIHNASNNYNSLYLKFGFICNSRKSLNCEHLYWKEIDMLPTHNDTGQTFPFPDGRMRLSSDINKTKIQQRKPKFFSPVSSIQNI